MNKREKDARKVLKGMEIIVTRRGGRHVDNFDSSATKNRNVFQNITDSVRTFRQGR